MHNYTSKLLFYEDLQLLTALIFSEVKQSGDTLQKGVAFNDPIFPFIYNVILHFYTKCGAFITKCTIVTYFLLYCSTTCDLMLINPIIKTTALLYVS